MPFQIMQCKLCAKPFQSTGGSLCHECLVQLDLDFSTIRDYLRENPGNTGVEEICEATGILKRNIIHLLRDNRLSFKSPEHDSLLCEVCRQPITGGRICSNCKDSLGKTLQGALPKTPPIEKTKSPPGSGGMHVRHLPRK